MKKFITACLVSGAFLATGSAMADTTHSNAAELAKICHTIKDGSASELRKEIRNLHPRHIPSYVTYQAITHDLKCNGHDAISFALLNNAMDNADYLARISNTNLAEFNIR